MGGAMKARERLYYIEAGGYCGLEIAFNALEARSYAAQQFGRDMITSVRLATQDDIDYIRGMGGHVPAELQQAVTP